MNYLQIPSQCKLNLLLNGVPSTLLTSCSSNYCKPKELLRVLLYGLQCVISSKGKTYGFMEANILFKGQNIRNIATG